MAIVRKTVNKTHLTAMLKALREAGATVTERQLGGYRATGPNGKECFLAIVGPRNVFLVKHDEQLFLSQA